MGRKIKSFINFEDIYNDKLCFIRGELKMKKIIAIILILVAGLLVLGGCTPTTTEPPQDEEQAPSPEPDQVQEQDGLDELPQPPAFPE